MNCRALFIFLSCLVISAHTEIFALSDIFVKVEEDRTESKQDRIDKHSKYGDGRFKTKQYIYRIELRSYAEGAIPGIRLRLLGYGNQRFQKKDDVRLKHVIEKKGITAPRSESIIVEMGPLEYFYGETKKVTTSSTTETTTNYTIGYENYAYVLEVYAGNELMETVLSKSTSKFERIYQKTKNSDPDHP